MKCYDFAIIGAGIAGASVAAEIAGDSSVLLLEAEDQPGYHSTGRSAAFWTESYGGPKVQPLTTASRSLLEQPPADFSATGFLKPRGAVNIARRDEIHLIDAFLAKFAASKLDMRRWSTEQLHQAVRHLNPDWIEAVFEPDCYDIDVAALHGAYLKVARRTGAQIVCNARVEQLKHHKNGWEIITGSQSFLANKLINAAGAWADRVAEMAEAKQLGIEPKRRTMVQIRTDPPSKPDEKLIIAIDGSFYAKPEAGGDYWLSPHDEIPDVAGDAAPDEMDIAIAIDRFQSAMAIEVKGVARKWAGLRSFAPDRLPVYGFDAAQPDFFWCAGQGGFGIQTAPAAAKLCKSLLLEESRDTTVRSVEASVYDPARFS